jgi:hypothetical protein
VGALSHNPIASVDLPDDTASMIRTGRTETRPKLPVARGKPTSRAS